MDALKTDRHLFRYAKRAAQIQISLHSDLDALSRYAHGCGDHLTRDLGARCQSSKQKVTRAGAGTGAPYALVGFRLVDGAADIDRACYGDAGLLAFRTDRDARSIGVIAILVFQRLLQRSKI